ncbi:MAG: crotonase/enoyl-CoA hydratase family protein [Gammaproteobacteria bacterium]|nr:crotonase/enoyl-CoA hydratase family protein [Gammaproteobacteria bacterium]
MSDRVTIAIDNGIADVRLARPEKHNAIDAGMFTAIEDALAALNAERNLRVVVLSGEGPAFCSGLDIASFAGGPEATNPLLQRGDDGLNRVQRVALGWQRLPVPVIAAVHGAAFGGGMQIALGADIRLFAADAKLSVMEVRWGIVPDMGITQTLRALVSLDVAKELCFTGRIVEAGEAVRLGLGAGIAEEPRDAAMDMAGEITKRSPDAIRAIKQLLNRSWNADEQSGLELEEQLQRQLLFSPNQVEAVRAQFEKREPRWT